MRGMGLVFITGTLSQPLHPANRMRTMALQEGIKFVLIDHRILRVVPRMDSVRHIEQVEAVILCSFYICLLYTSPSPRD